MNLGLDDASQLRDNMPELRKVFREGSPVLILGPGCDRVGFRDGAEWSEVRRRVGVLHAGLPTTPHRAYLQRFWRGKLESAGGTWTLAEVERELSDGAGLDAGDPIMDRVRTQGLATPLLEVLVTCTSLLGKVIETGETPVASWDTVFHPIGLDRDKRTRQEASRCLQHVADVCDALSHWADDLELDRDERAELQGLGFEPEMLERGTRADHQLWGDRTTRLKILNVFTIRLVATWLAGNCLDPEGPGHRFELTGATIEWLGDLLWHVLIADSGVPPSQRELVFYVNLGDVAGNAVTARWFSRAQAGEFRGADPAELPEMITRRMAFVDKGTEPQIAEDSRQRVAAVLAASLLELAEKDGDHGWRTIALSTSYSLVLERHLLELLPENEHFHVVVPATFDTEETWLLGTYTRRSGPVRKTDLHKCVTWSRYDAERDLAAGPIVVKMNGSPFLRLPSDATESSLFGEGPSHEENPYEESSSDRRVRLSSVFSERQVLSTSMALRQSRENGKTFSERSAASCVVAALDWNARDWLMFGESFPDWLPRLRLLLNVDRAGLGGRTGEAPPKRIAVDRHFDWPERALLDGLNIEHWFGDLALLAELPTPHDGFFRGVQQRLPSGAEGAR